MTAASLLITELRSSLADASERIARDFAATGDGRAAIAQRTLLIEDILNRLWGEFVSSDEQRPRGFALVATGGFGRGWLFPYSDIDLLFLFTIKVASRLTKRRSSASLRSCGISNSN